jgi:hypothetical protein
MCTPLFPLVGFVEKIQPYPASVLPENLLWAKPQT